MRRGGDIHVCVDGNFNHRHLRGIRQIPQDYDPQYFIPKSTVDEVGQRLDEMRNKPPPKEPKRKAKACDAAIDDCEDSHTAGRGSNTKTKMDRFDAGGVMALVCRHDIPLFLANIDTPGEHQKYAMSLIEHLLKLVPNTATLSIFYDIGCVLHRSIIKVGTLFWPVIHVYRV